MPSRSCRRHHCRRIRLVLLGRSSAARSSSTTTSASSKDGFAFGPGRKTDLRPRFGTGDTPLLRDASDTPLLHAVRSTSTSRHWQQRASHPQIGQWRPWRRGAAPCQHCLRPAIGGAIPRGHCQAIVFVHKHNTSRFSHFVFVANKNKSNKKHQQKTRKKAPLNGHKPVVLVGEPRPSRPSRHR